MVATVGAIRLTVENAVESEVNWLSKRALKYACYHFVHKIVNILPRQIVLWRWTGLGCARKGCQEK